MFPSISCSQVLVRFNNQVPINIRASRFPDIAMAGFDSYSYMPQGYSSFPYTQSLEDSESQEIPSSQPTPPLPNYPVHFHSFSHGPVARRSAIFQIYPYPSSPLVTEPSQNPAEIGPEPNQERKPRGRKTKEPAKARARDMQKGRGTN